jgi:hypothetical protein
MITLRNLLLGVLVCPAIAMVPARAADTSAKAFVEAAYAAYQGKDQNGISLGRDAVVKRYFEPNLATLIIGDAKAAARRGEVPRLDGDPFIDGQDWQLDSFAIVVRDISPSKAIATVSFKNFDKPTTVVLDLVRLKAGWRVADISWGRKDTLRGLYRKK